MPDASSSPNLLPANFFNVTSPRGVVFSTPGTGFRVSGDGMGSGALQFGDVDATYPTTFAVFSAQRLFTPDGATVTDVNFFIPGSTTPAVTKAFGAVFTDVDTAGAAKLQLFDKDGNQLYAGDVPTYLGSESLSFLGIYFADGSGIARARITSGTGAIGPGVHEGGMIDLVVLDDFIYAEPGEQTGGGGPPPPTDTDGDLCDAPTLSKLGIRRKRRGFRISYDLSEAAQVTLRVERRRGTYWRRVRGRISKSGHTGHNTFAWNGKLRRKRLRPGTYRLVAEAVDGSGRHSAKQRRRFSVRRR